MPPLRAAPPHGLFAAPKERKRSLCGPRLAFSALTRSASHNLTWLSKMSRKPFRTLVEFNACAL